MCYEKTMYIHQYYTYRYISDPAWKNRVYNMHVKLDQFLELWRFLTLCLIYFVNETFATSTVHNAEFNTIYRPCTLYTVGKVGGIMGIIWRSVFYAHKQYYLMPSHKWDHNT